MALPKTLDRIEQKLDRILEILEQPAFPVGEPLDTEALDPAAVAAALDYDSYTAAEVIDRVASLTDAERAALVEYESAGKARPTVLKALGA
jgi:hypothetical protein